VRTDDCTTHPNDGGTLKVIGYARKSIAENGNGHSLDAQEETIRAEAARRGWHVVGIVRDDGHSGRDTHRPGLMRALAAVAAGEADGVVAAKLDRISRSVVDFGTLLDWFRDAGAALVALDVGVDTSTPAGRLVANVMASVAEWERETIAARTRDGLKVAAAKGRRPAPAVEGELRDRIRAMREGRATYQQIADTLNAEGVPTLRGAAKWQVSSVRGAAGYRRPAKRRRPAELPSLPKRRAAA
jgi:DNA invertase Pin-like site-specific DNA recombinase